MVTADLAAGMDFILTTMAMLFRSPPKSLIIKSKSIFLRGLEKESKKHSTISKNSRKWHIAFSQKNKEVDDLPADGGALFSVNSYAAKYIRPSVKKEGFYEKEIRNIQSSLFCGWSMQIRLHRILDNILL